MDSRPPLFPEQASTFAPQVDALYFFLIALAVFFSLLIAGLVIYFAVKYRRRSENEPPPQALLRRSGARDRLVGHSVPHLDGYLRLGRELVLQD